jgi:hypothetical protein
MKGIYNILAIIMLVAAVSMCNAVALKSSSLKVGSEQVYGSSEGINPATDNSQDININVIGSNNQITVGQQRVGTDKPDSIKSKVAASMERSKAAAKIEQEDDCLEADCTQVTPDEVETVSYDYYCEVTAPAFLDLMRNFFQIQGDNGRFVAENTRIYSYEKLLDNTAGIDVTTTDPVERADILRAACNHPILLASNGKMYVLAVNYHDGITLELFKVTVSNERFVFSSIGWGITDGSTATVKTPAMKGTPEAMIQWGDGAAQEWRNMGYA